MIHRRSGDAACLSHGDSVMWRDRMKVSNSRRQRDVVELLLCCVVNVGRPGILKTHCFGLVAGDKCHDIADHFTYAGSGCHKCQAVEDLRLTDPILCPDLSLSSFEIWSLVRSGSWKAISFKSGSTLFSILRSKAKKGIRPKCAGIMWWNDICVCLGRYIVSCWIMWQSRELALFIAGAGMRRACMFSGSGVSWKEAIDRCISSAVDRYRREASKIEDYDRSMYILYHRSMSRRETHDLVPADFKPKASPNYKITPDECMPSSTRSNKNKQLLFSEDPAHLERSIRKDQRSTSIDAAAFTSTDSRTQPSTDTRPSSSTDLHRSPSIDTTPHQKLDAQGNVIPHIDATGAAQPVEEAARPRALANYNRPDEYYAN
ncbi:hypothetical protein DY000_02015584 [Brassica cretica]|uniref:Uncharacterized protein n=1 Tax=Brassica cretica TaxID=69181 RepID=A0ABQ7D1A7_BRACR|nr:hypothetical protein DY000_02015584 [Brassica cretica]